MMKKLLMFALLGLSAGNALALVAHGTSEAERATLTDPCPCNTCPTVNKGCPWTCGGGCPAKSTGCSLGCGSGCK